MENDNVTVSKSEQEIIAELKAALSRANDIMDQLLARASKMGLTPSQQASFQSLWSNTKSLKGTKPAALFLPGRREPVDVKTWKEAVHAIMKDCNEDDYCHSRLMELCDKYYGRSRIILASSPDRMDKPLKIDDGLYLESFFDTDAMLKILTTDILPFAGYPWQDIQVQLCEPRQAEAPVPKMEPPDFQMKMR